MKFSQRIGKTPVRTVLQVDSMDDDLRNRLWNVVLEDFFDKLNSYTIKYEIPQKEETCRFIWKEFFHLRIDEIPLYQDSNSVYIEGFIDYTRDWFLKAEWFVIYDFVEFISFIDRKVDGIFTTRCNRALANEVSGYRIVNEKVVQITSEEEVQAIEEATTDTDQWKSVNTHLKTALDHLSNRKNPNYRNSIKESISAVEAFCKIVTKDDTATLGKALTEIERQYQIHGALKTAFSAIYGYTSDGGGIRHALLESDVKTDFGDAKFMLVACSAFINYLKSKLNV